MYHRTKTYIAGDWTGDQDLIDKIIEWNDDGALDFVDVHEFKQARDDSLNCTIKDSLSERMRMCKKFVLVVGNQTKLTQSGSCIECSKYSYSSTHCSNGKKFNNDSYIIYECKKAVEQDLKIIVLYN